MKFSSHNISYLILSSLFSLLLCIHTQAQPSNSENVNIIRNLKSTFENAPSVNTKQYGVMYLHPPNLPFTSAAYVPTPPASPVPKGQSTYPFLAPGTIQFPYNYVGSAPLNGIHTEDKCLNTVFPKMSAWFRSRYNQEPAFVHLYTYYLPCPQCVSIIDSFVKRYQNIRLYVGFTSLYGGNREDHNPQSKKATQKRKSDLETFLSSNGGHLYTIRSNTQTAEKKWKRKEGEVVIYTIHNDNDNSNERREGTL